VKKQQNLLGEIRGLIISSQGILGDNQSPHGNNQFPKGDQGNKTISLRRHKKTSSRKWIGTKKIFDNLQKIVKMCYKSKFSQIVIIILDNCPTKVWSMKGLPNHNTCHISSCSPTHSQNVHNFIDFTNLVVICNSSFHEYVFDLMFLTNISNSLWK